ncbi:DUF420 domain-containing protein [Ectobacillus panaciterrae]|uniref:DUF420 domain-containing protein n=1 Tax=Ectobacillus panaciterrae TaxID=363872 RepID=UPI0004057FF8|nr:DUF420 domain-containing protein [Ectobacillus panaciterrae]
MSTPNSPANGRNYTALVVGLSIVVNALILLLFFGPVGYKGKVGFDTSILPRINAVLNSFTFIFLVAALYFIKRKNITLHKRFILAAFTTTLLFCVSYVTHQYLSQPTHYGGAGLLRYIYFFILITHSVLAAIIVPLALFSLIWGWTGQVAKHRKIVRWSMPIWLYVSFTGVIVYLMISPYY